MNLQELRELGKKLKINKAHVKGAETLVKEINAIHKAEGLELVKFIDVPTVDGIEIPQGVDPVIAAAVVSTKLSKKIEYEKEQAKKEKIKINDKLSFEEKARIAAEKALINPNIDSYIYKGNNTKYKNKCRKRAIRKKRVIVTVIDPSRLVKFGEIFKTRNTVAGVVTELVMYNEYPQHLSQITINALKEIQFCKFVPDEKGGRKIQTKKQKYANAFRIQELPDLTLEEWEELKKEQSSRASRIEA